MPVMTLIEKIDDEITNRETTTFDEFLMELSEFALITDLERLYGIKEQELIKKTNEVSEVFGEDSIESCEATDELLRVQKTIEVLDKIRTELT